MQRKSFSDMNCTIAKSLDEVGEWWSLLIVRELTQGASRFDEIQRGLGIARNILTTRLERLTQLGIVEKADGYHLTQKGEQLYPVIVALQQWGDRWLANDGKPPFALVGAETGEPLAPIAVHTRDGKPLSYKDVRIMPGPGATDTTRAIIAERNRRVLGEAS